MIRGTNETYEVYKYILRNRCNSITICFDLVYITYLSTHHNTFCMANTLQLLRAAVNGFG